MWNDVVATLTHGGYKRGAAADGAGEPADQGGGLGQGGAQQTSTSQRDMSRLLSLKTLKANSVPHKKLSRRA
jgi:hypothetical protein